MNAINHVLFNRNEFVRFLSDSEALLSTNKMRINWQGMKNTCILMEEGMEKS